MSDFLNGFADFFFPPLCLSCSEILSKHDDGGLCKLCNSELYFIDKESRCLKCGLPKESCMCNSHIYYFENAVCTFVNKGSARNIMYRYKLGGKKHYCPFIAENMINSLKSEYSNIEFDFLTPVPSGALSRYKHKSDHTLLLAKEISKRTGIPLKTGVIGIKPFKKSQHRTAETKKRFENTRDKYFVKKKGVYNNILLIDDIKTTGATLSACSKELLFAGARRVYCLTALAGVRGKDDKTDIKKDIKKL